MAAPELVTYDFANDASDIPAGRWDVVVSDLIPATTSKHEAYTKVQFTVIDGDHTAGQTRYVGKRVAPKQTWLLGMVLKATGFAPKGASNAVTVDRAALIDYILVIDLTYRKFNDVDYPNVTAVLTVEEAAPTEDSELPF